MRNNSAKESYIFESLRVVANPFSAGNTSAEGSFSAKEPSIITVYYPILVGSLGLFAYIGLTDIGLTAQNK